MNNTIEFMNCINAVSSDLTELTEGQRNGIIGKTSGFLDHISAGRYCDLDEEFFLQGGVEENMFAAVPLEEEDYLLFDALVNAYRKECVSLFGEEILPRTEYYSDIGATEEKMTEDPFDYLGYQTHVFLRAVTLKRCGEIFSAIAQDGELVCRLDERLSDFDPDYPAGEVAPGKVVSSYMNTLEQCFVISFPGARMGDETPLPLAIQVQHAVFCRLLAESGEKVPIGVFLSQKELESL